MGLGKRLDAVRGEDQVKIEGAIPELDVNTLSCVGKAENDGAAFAKEIDPEQPAG